MKGNLNFQISYKLTCILLIQKPPLTEGTANRARPRPVWEQYKVNLSLGRLVEPTAAHQSNTTFYLQKSTERGEAQLGGKKMATMMTWHKYIREEGKINLYWSYIREREITISGSLDALSYSLSLYSGISIFINWWHFSLTWTSCLFFCITWIIKIINVIWPTLNTVLFNVPIKWHTPVKNPHSGTGWRFFFKIDWLVSPGLDNHSWISSVCQWVFMEGFLVV